MSTTQTLYRTVISSPALDALCGPLVAVVEREGGVAGIAFCKGKPPLEVGEWVEETWRRRGVPLDDVDGSDEAMAPLVRQLEEYATGRRRTFDLELRPHGTDFQLEVWRQLQEIPFGETRSYRDIAHAIGRPQAVRAVGAANGANPLPIVVPCHRVIGANGTLTGFGGGLEAKANLLRLEGIESSSRGAYGDRQTRLVF